MENEGKVLVFSMLIAFISVFLLSWFYWFDSLSEEEFQQGEIVVQELIEGERSINDIPENFSIKQCEGIIELKAANEFTTGKVKGTIFSHRIEREDEVIKRILSNIVVAVVATVVIVIIEAIILG